MRARRSEGGSPVEDGLGGNVGEGEVVSDECRHKVTTEAKMAEIRVPILAKRPLSVQA